MTDNNLFCVCEETPDNRNIYLHLYNDLKEATAAALSCFRMLSEYDKKRVSYSVEYGRFAYDDNGRILLFYSITKKIIQIEKGEQNFTLISL